ncbi:MAG: phospholipase D family protein [Candidatus Helarchaeota archaeon]
MDYIKIIATGEEWIGYGIRSFSEIIKELIKKAENKIYMTIYIITDLNIINHIKYALNKGISIDIFIYSHPFNVSAPIIKELTKLRKEYNYLQIHKIENRVLHAKVMIIDGKKVLLGSANITYGGLVKNYELGILINNENIASKIITLLRKLI